MSKRVRVASLGAGGDGITDDGVFVPFATPGDVLDVTRDGKRGRIDRIVEPSPQRITPVCPHFGTCGACQVQHIAPDPYRAWKRGRVVQALEQAGLDTVVTSLINAHGEGRRRVTFAAKHGVAGYHERGSHTVMPVEVCPILSPGLAGAIPFVKALAAEWPDRWLSILVTETAAGMDADIKGPLKGTMQINARLASLAKAHGLARLTAEREPIALYRTPTIPLGPVAAAVFPSGAFLQVTAAAETILGDLAIAALKRARKVVDLFCGIGPFSLRAAQHAQVYAADSDEAAIAALRRSAAQPGLKPITAERRDLFRRPLVPSELEPFDAAILDPPFDGAAAQIAELAASRVPLIVYISCNPLTFARDAATLTQAGYRLGTVTPVDQFLYATHVELVGIFEKA